MEYYHRDSSAIACAEAIGPPRQDGNSGGTLCRELIPIGQRVLWSLGDTAGIDLLKCSVRCSRVLSAKSSKKVRDPSLEEQSQQSPAPSGVAVVRENSLIPA